VRTQDLEPEMEELLLRLAPDLPAQWQGATEQEIEQITKFAGRPLPRFYRWFLLRMGRSMGAISYATLDFSAPKILSYYTERFTTPDSRFLMIAHESDEMVPLHLFYHFEHPVRDDARVVLMDAGRQELYNHFETLREMIAWGRFLQLRVKVQPNRCRGIFSDTSGDVREQLDLVLDSLGFTTPISTGPYCGIYEGDRASMVTSSSIDDPPRIQPFQLGGNDAGYLRRVLGEIAAETSLEVEIKEWNG
jgi:hypothetical protein